jgi:hypothetical protein
MAQSMCLITTILNEFEYVTMARFLSLTQSSESNYIYDSLGY